MSLSLAPRLLQRSPASGHGITGRPPHCEMELNHPPSLTSIGENRPRNGSLYAREPHGGVSKPSLAQVGSIIILFGDAVCCCFDIGHLGTCVFFYP